MHTLPFRPSEGLLIIPLLSWYDEYDIYFHRLNACGSSMPRQVECIANLYQPRTESPNHFLVRNNDHLLELAENWMDYSACKWPPPLKSNFAQMGDNSTNKQFARGLINTCHATVRQAHTNCLDTERYQDCTIPVRDAYEYPQTSSITFVPGPPTVSNH